MTDRSDFKRLVRRRMLETGESYTVARSHFTVPSRDTAAHESVASAQPVTVAPFKRRVYTRKRTKELAAHLEQRYGFTCSGITKLDLGVYRVDRTGSPSWIARVFSSARAMESANGDAEILGYLERLGFPAERVTHADPVSVLAGQPVLVTEYVAGNNHRDDMSEEVMRALGTMVGQLHSLPEGPGACMREAGSWHHLSVDGGSRRRDIEILRSLLEDAETHLGRDDRRFLAELVREVQELDDFEDLPKALIHPDPCGANLIGPQEEAGLLVDWTGAGTGPRLISFANMISSAKTLVLVDEAVWGYRAHASLELDELDRLEAALVGFPLILDSWMFLIHGAPLAMLLKRLAAHKERARGIAARARASFAASLPIGDETPRVNESQESLF